MFYGHAMWTMGPEPSARAVDTGARADARKAASTVASMQHHVERLLMITEALWDMLKEQHGYTDEDLMERVQQIDMRDGKLDGKVAPTQVNTCSYCKRPISVRHATCIYCGRALGGDPFAR